MKFRRKNPTETETGHPAEKEAEDKTEHSAHHPETEVDNPPERGGHSPEIDYGNE